MPKPDAPLVSVVVPAYRAALTLEEAVTSCLGQTMEDLDVLIVEDGSDDGTLEAAERCRDADPDRVRVLRHPGGSNRGVAASRNLGLEEARGAFVAFLDADDAWLPHKLEVQMRGLEEFPEGGFAFSNVFLSEDAETGRPMREQPLAPDPLRAGMADLFDGEFGAARALNLGEYGHYYVPSPTPLVRRSMFEGGLRFVGPPRLSVQYEDYLMWRCLAMRTPFHYVDEELAIYRIHGDSFTGRFPAGHTNVDHLRGLHEVQELFLEECGEEVDGLGWREEIRDRLRGRIIAHVHRTATRDVPALLALAARSGCLSGAIRKLTSRVALRTWYGAHNVAKALRRSEGG